MKIFVSLFGPTEKGAKEKGRRKKKKRLEEGKRKSVGLAGLKRERAVCPLGHSRPVELKVEVGFYGGGKRKFWICPPVYLNAVSTSRLPFIVESSNIINIEI